MSEGVAPDGSPVAVYLALPPEPDFAPILELLKPPATVLDLGCGVGRLANELVRRGFTVTGVDESEDMLAQVSAGVATVQCRLQRLNLDRRFDVVVLASHFVNVAEDDERRSFLRAAAAHVADHGMVLVQHWEDGALLDTDAEVAGVRIAFRVLKRQGNVFDGRVRFSLDGRSWVQDFRARLMDDEELEGELNMVGLRFAERVHPKWLVARPASGEASRPAR